MSGELTSPERERSEAPSSVAEPEPRPYASAPDADFWTQTLSGLVALRHGNTWAAARTLERLREEVMTPLLAAASHDEIGALFPETDDPASRWQDETATSVFTLHATLTRLLRSYQALVEDYRRLRAREADGEAHACPAEAKVDEQLAQMRPEDMVTPPQIISLTPLSVVLPAYNEEPNIAETVEECVTTLARICPNFEIIVVDDGSHDQTGAIADSLALADATIRVTHNRPNKGYGGALRAGFDAAEGEWLFFMDSDGQFDIRDIAQLLRIEQQHPGTAVVGYRARRSDVFMRKINAWGWKVVTRVMIGLRDIRDIDCAFKLFPTKLIRACDLQSTGAAVSAEFLAKFQRFPVPIVQIPVKHLPRRKGHPTGARLDVILRAFLELVRLREHLRTWSPAI